VTIKTPRLLLDFLTYNSEVQAQIKNTIYGDGPGVNMPFREVALVRKTLNNIGTTKSSVDINMGMTGRAVQKIWIAKVMDIPAGNAELPILYGDCRSDLLAGQKWNVRVNDLMIYDRDVDNRAEEFNYCQQTGEKKLTLPPATFEQRVSGVADRVDYVAADDIWKAGTAPLLYLNPTDAHAASGSKVNCPTDAIRYGIGNFMGARNDPIFHYHNNAGQTKQGAPVNVDNVKNQMMGHKNYLGINLARYKDGAESPLNAMRIGSTPILFTLERDGTHDQHITGSSGVVYFWVEYLKMMNLKNGQITVMDL
jgi:hypothetical protein